jgi:hypothetical protein
MAEEVFDDAVNEETVTEGGGFRLVVPGLYFFQITEVSNNDEEFYIEAEVLSGTKPDMAGEVHREYFKWNTKDGNRKRRSALCVAAEVYTLGDIAAAREKGESLRWEPDDLYGKTFCAEIINEEQEMGKYAGQMRARIPYHNIYHPDGKDAKRLRIPVDKSKVKNLSDDPFGNPPEAAHAATETTTETGQRSFF